VTRTSVRALGLVLGAVLTLSACVPGPPEDIAGAAQAATPVEEAVDSVLRIRSVSPCGTSIGSGFVLEGGLLVTNRHVIEGARRIQVETWDGRPVAIGAARVGVETDLGIIDLPRATVRRFDALPLADEPLGLGTPLAALGYAQAGPVRTTRGQFLDRAPGRRFEEPGPVLRMSTSVQPGNSGGPLLDEDAHVVGVVYAYEVATLLSLAVPRERLQDVLADPAALEPVRPCGV
jgi:S1-C subfamily serine protease